MKVILRDEGSEETIEVESMEAARVAARDWLREGDWDLSGGTLWVDGWVIPVLDGVEQDGEKVTVRVDPPAPKCLEGEHEWDSPYNILGGSRENPGVWGKGGGVLIKDVCMKCGCGRTIDTWAQRRDTGEQGLRSVSYEPGRYAEEVSTLIEALV
jgi:hypothetical protein